ncbi:MAG: hypothetical protein RL139_253 [Gemmatimonadota bacterium]
MSTRRPGPAVARLAVALLVAGCLSRPVVPDEPRIGRMPIPPRRAPGTHATPSGAATDARTTAEPSTTSPSSGARRNGEFDPSLPTITGVGTAPAPAAAAGILVRVALRVATDSLVLASASTWRLLDEDGGVLARARAGERWTLQRRGLRIRAVRADGTATAWRTRPMTQLADEGAPATVDGKAYRGALLLFPTDSGALVVNELPLEEYLRGVVPLEIGGTRGEGDQPAVEAQAVAARSYTVDKMAAARRSRTRTAPFDLLATISDQVYGGVAAERPLSDAAVERTAGLVLLWDGRVVSAPYHSTCGGRTATAAEAWRGGGAPYLREVSDRVPGTDRDYCDISPRYAWTRTLAASEVDAAVRRYLANYVAVGAGGPGAVRDLVVTETSSSGRAAEVVIWAERGSYRLRGSEARSVLRSSAGEPLLSAYFSLAVERVEGRLSRVVVRGKGYGHGVGMCQWGAIGRARAGQDARTILATYYPGTTVGPVPDGTLTP